MHLLVECIVLNICAVFEELQGQHVGGNAYRWFPQVWGFRDMFCYERSAILGEGGQAMCGLPAPPVALPAAALIRLM